MGVIAPPIDFRSGLNRRSKQWNAMSEDALGGGENGEFEGASTQRRSRCARVGQGQRKRTLAVKAGASEQQIEVRGFLPQTKFDFRGTAHSAGDRFRIQGRAG